MRRLKKAFLLIVRTITYRKNMARLYYWAEAEMVELNSVHLMPRFYYRWLFQACMRLVNVRHCHRLAERAIHSIPYHIRFEMA
jgi:hypothetical protein